MFPLTCFSAFISWAVLLSVQSSFGSEIIGGKEVKPHSKPFMARLRTNNSSCGGTLIQESWVLTAAHCGAINQVFLGLHSISSKNEIKSRQIRKVQKLFPHPSYDKTTHRHDLMLVKLDQPVKATKTVKWLKFGKKIKDPKAGTVCEAAGWGKTNYKFTKGSDVLMSVMLKVLDRNKCNSGEHYNKRPVITEDMVCAGTDNKSICNGDSGGPLICKKVVVGVTSFGGIECGSAKRPGVFTFISPEHLSWIQNIIKS